jgi:ribosomal-protein-alanine N-acetyltransferase
MSAVLRTTPPRLSAMRLAHVDEVLALETHAYSFPWTRGNFVDSLVAGYTAEVLRDDADELIGYFIAMAGVQEMHLLNLAVAPAHQGRGHGRYMLDQLVERCRDAEALMLWLEVRQSNHGARRLYERYGFVDVGMRRGYYPAAMGRREDAVVMSLDLAHRGGTHGLD